MFLVSPCSSLCPVHWSQVLSREWRCSWSSADRQCSNYIWAINNFYCLGATYIGGFTVSNKMPDHQISWSFEVMRLGVKIIVSLWSYLRGSSAALLLSCLSNIRVIRSYILTLRFCQIFGKDILSLKNTGPNVSGTLLVNGAAIWIPF